MMTDTWGKKGGVFILDLWKIAKISVEIWFSLVVGFLFVCLGVLVWFCFCGVF